MTVRAYYAVLLLTLTALAAVLVILYGRAEGWLTWLW